MSAATCPTSPADRPGGVMTTEIDLAAIRAREDNATKGPWTVGPRELISAEVYERTILAPAPTEDGPDDLGELAVIRYWAGAFQYPHADAYADAEFIAHAREDIPALLVEIGRLRADLEFAHGEAKSIYDTCKQIERERDELLAALVELAPAKAAE